MRVLVTRPAEPDDPYIALVRTLGGEPLSCPLYEGQALTVPLELAGVRALVFTSAYGVRSFAAQSPQRDLPVYAVGPQTGEAARAAGFRHVTHAGGTAADMMTLIPDHAGPVLYGRGEDISYPVVETLRGRGIDARGVILYKMVSIDASLPRPPVDIALFFSARTAQSFVDIVIKQGLRDNFSQTKALCLGAGMVEFLQDLPWASVQVAARPDRAAMTALIENAMIGHK